MPGYTGANAAGTVLLRREAAVDEASVDVFPAKSCECETPGEPGKTMGSFAARWSKRHTTMNRGAFEELTEDTEDAVSVSGGLVS